MAIVFLPLPHVAAFAHLLERLAVGVDIIQPRDDVAVVFAADHAVFDTAVRVRVILDLRRIDVFAFAKRDVITVGPKPIDAVRSNKTPGRHDDAPLVSGQAL